MIEIKNDSLKKVLIILAISLPLFWLIKPKADKKNGSNSLMSDGMVSGSSSDAKPDFIKKLRISDDQMQDGLIANAYNIYSGYIDAYNAKEDDETMQGIRDVAEQEYGFQIIDNGDGKVSITDMNGNTVLA